MNALHRLPGLLSLPRDAAASASGRFTYSWGAVGESPRILGVGTDIVERGRIAAAIAEPRFREKMCGPGELKRLAAGGGRAVAFASRVFAVKEALLKAVGPARCASLAPADVEIEDAAIEDETGEGGALRLTARASGLLRDLGVEWMQAVVTELPDVTLAVAAVGAAQSH